MFPNQNGELHAISYLGDGGGVLCFPRASLFLAARLTHENSMTLWLRFLPPPLTWFGGHALDIDSPHTRQ